MRELKHLSEIFENYDTFVIDLWGVMHNGVVLNSKAIDAINQLKNNAKKIVFLSNAPRPSFQVVNFLLKMKMDKKFLTNVITSGEAAMHAINNKQFGKTFFHLGPPRDTDVFEKVKENKAKENQDSVLRFLDKTEKINFTRKNGDFKVFITQWEELHTYSNTLLILTTFLGWESMLFLGF